MTADETRTVRDYCWTDEHLLYLQDDGGDENWHLFRVDLGVDPSSPGAAAVDLTPFPGVRVLDLTVLAARPGTAILQLTGAARSWQRIGDGTLLVERLTDAHDIELLRTVPGTDEHPVATPSAWSRRTAQPC